MTSSSFAASHLRTDVHAGPIRDFHRLHHAAYCALLVATSATVFLVNRHYCACIAQQERKKVLQPQVK